MKLDIHWLIDYNSILFRLSFVSLILCFFWFQFSAFITEWGQQQQEDKGVYIAFAVGLGMGDGIQRIGIGIGVNAIVAVR